MKKINNVGITALSILGLVAAKAGIDGSTHQFWIAGICAFLVAALASDNVAKKTTKKTNR